MFLWYQKAGRRACGTNNRRAGPDRHPKTASEYAVRWAEAARGCCGQYDLQKDLLVFDEPTSGLDFDSMTQVAALIKKLSDAGKVIFIVTHDYEFVCRTCSRVLHFDEGEMIEDLTMEPGNLVRWKELFHVSEEISQTGYDEKGFSCDWQENCQCE